MLIQRFLVFAVLLMWTGVNLQSQTATLPTAAPAQHPRQVTSPHRSLTLGPGDQLTVGAPEIEELDRRVLRVQADGTVSVPLIGMVKASGLTPEEFRDKVNQALSTQFRNPHIDFTSIDIRSKPLSVLGAVNSPGVMQADGRQHLLEIISLAGGLRNDAGTTVTVTRKASAATSFPAGLRTTLTGNYVVATIPVTGLMEGTDPNANIPVYPGDTITVPKGQLVYVVGDVQRSGGFIVGETNDLSVLKAISLAQGLKETADTGHARILRSDETGKRTEQYIDLKKLLAGKSEDIDLKANDILYIPSSTRKKVTARAVQAAVDAGTGIMVYRQPF